MDVNGPSKAGCGAHAKECADGSIVTSYADCDEAFTYTCVDSRIEKGSSCTNPDDKLKDMYSEGESFCWIGNVSSFRCE